MQNLCQKTLVMDKAKWKSIVFNQPIKLLRVSMERIITIDTGRISYTKVAYSCEEMYIFPQIKNFNF